MVGHYTVVRVWLQRKVCLSFFQNDDLFTRSTESCFPAAFHELWTVFKIKRKYNNKMDQGCKSTHHLFFVVVQAEYILKIGQQSNSVHISASWTRFLHFVSFPFRVATSISWGGGGGGYEGRALKFVVSLCATPPPPITFWKLVWKILTLTLYRISFKSVNKEIRKSKYCKYYIIIYS